MPKSKWYETNQFWGLLGLGTGLILTALTTVMQDSRWLLWLAAPCFVGASWVYLKQIRHKGLRRGAIVVSFPVTVIAVVFASKLLPFPTVPQPRIRILDVVVVPTSASGAAFPAMNIYYDNAGTAVATGIVSRFGTGFGGMMSDAQTLREQDKLLAWDGWKGEMDRRKQHEMRPGDPGEFTSIPKMEGTLAQQFRDNWQKVSDGSTVLHIFITFKYLDPSGRVLVTENCFWFSGGFARHTCGRGRTFVETN